MTDWETRMFVLIVFSASSMMIALTVMMIGHMAGWWVLS